MSKPLYAVPASIADQCDQRKYSRRLRAKAMAHVRRDRRRFGRDSCTVARYKSEIHAAVCAGGNCDYYTGEVLDWRLVSTYENAASMEGRAKYKSRFALLPTLDHALDERGQRKFVICSWRVNDARNDLTESEFYDLCVRVVEHQKRRKPRQSSRDDRG